MLWLILLALIAYGAYLYSNSEAAAGGAAERPACILPTVPDFEEEEEEEGGSASPSDLVSRTVESLDWLNEITKATWPHVCAIVNKGRGCNRAARRPAVRRYSRGRRAACVDFLTSAAPPSAAQNWAPPPSPSSTPRCPSR
jgi:hypothetical protein